jgi:hypothetical protein
LIEAHGVRCGRIIICESFCDVHLSTGRWLELELVLRHGIVWQKLETSCPLGNPHEPALIPLADGDVLHAAQYPIALLVHEKLYRRCDGIEVAVRSGPAKTE